MSVGEASGGHRGSEDPVGGGYGGDPPSGRPRNLGGRPRQGDGPPRDSAGLSAGGGSEPGGFEAWRAERGGGGFSEWLRAVSGPTWEAAVTHRFTEELFRGAVPDGVMRTYLVQDYQFVDGFLALLGAAVASADRYSSRVALGRQLGLLTGEEDTYFQRAFDALGVPEAERRDPPRSDATRAFNALMDEARKSAVYPYCLAVLTVAEWLYLDWASRAPHDLPEDFLYRDWIRLHDNPEFRAWVGWLRGELDRVGPALDPARRRRCRELFVRAVELELRFFDAAYQ